jgi:hypothetical protein
VPDPGFPYAPPKWTRWLLPGMQHGVALPNQNKLAFAYSKQAEGNNVLGLPTAGIYVERKNGVVSTDFVDHIQVGVANPASATTDTLTFPQDVHLEVFPGDVFSYNPGGAGTKIYFSTVQSVNKAVVVLWDSIPFTAGGTLTYYRAIQSHWRYAPITLGEPTFEKQWQHVQAFFSYIDGDFINVLIDSEKAPLRLYSIVPTDPLVSNLGGTVATSTKLPGQKSLPGPDSKAVGTVQWLRNCRDVVLRVDPGQAEARAARLGVEFVFAQAQRSFKLAALSALADSAKPTSTR